MFQSSRTAALGICMAVGGLAGGVHSAVGREGIWKALGIFSVGVLGVLIVVSYFVHRTDR
ncbi:hypothetical protein ACFYQA_31670 [Streptomyces sp. NPDC005774]|uniref:hypothetical protein n=1 Tax=Streptomyces sp. NPDC005774 TaxID=3364728 RepID=UPI003676C0DE